MTERELLNAVRDHFADAGFEVQTEVPLMSQCIDLVVFDPRECTYTAVELKLRDWRMALRQTANHRLACESVAICLPTRVPSDALLTACHSSGTGLMLFDVDSSTMDHVVSARPEPELWAPAREWLVRAFDRRKEAPDGC